MHRSICLFSSLLHPKHRALLIEPKRWLSEPFSYFSITNCAALKHIIIMSE